MTKVINKVRKKPKAETQPWFNPEYSMLFVHWGCGIYNGGGGWGGGLMYWEGVVKKRYECISRKRQTGQEVGRQGYRCELMRASPGHE